jgi:hypothetical protein
MAGNTAELRDAAREFADQLFNTIIERGNQYGDPVNLFPEIAREFAAELGTEVTDIQACRLMMRLKLQRSIGSPNHLDNYLDLAGYALLAWVMQRQKLREAAEAEERSASREATMARFRARLQEGSHDVV